VLVFDGQCRQLAGLPPGRRCVILNSRQSKRPCNRDDWVSGTVRAVGSAIGQDLTVITSVGLSTWELTVHLVNIRGGRQIVVLPSMAGEPVASVIGRTLADFRLDPSRCLFVTPVAATAPVRGAKGGWPERDVTALELADALLPVSIRPGGSFDGLLRGPAAAHKEVSNDFRVDYHPSLDRVRYNFAHCSGNPALDDPNWRYVIHWTRSSHDPYPGETRFEYYRDILTTDTYCRSAYHTLLRIAVEKTIRSSNRFIRGGYRVVSFSALHPLDAVRLMRWRRRYVSYSFEPYGVAVRTDCAVAAGLRPVIYGNDAVYARLAENERPFFQKHGSQVADWRPEEEWRYEGGFGLGNLPVDGVRLITYSRQEAIELQRLTEYEVTPLKTS